MRFFHIPLPSLAPYSRPSVLPFSFSSLDSLKTIADAELIIVLADGRVAEQGTHKSLMAAGGTYFKMWNQQASSIYDVEETPDGEVVSEEGEAVRLAEEMGGEDNSGSKV